MKIIYNEPQRYQLEKVNQAIALATATLALDEFYDDIAQQPFFDYAHRSYTPRHIASMLKELRDSDIEIKVEHYYANYFQRKTRYRNTYGMVFPIDPSRIQLLYHNINRTIYSLAETIIHEFVHCVDGLEEKLQNKRVIWNFTHRGNTSAGNEFAAPNRIASLAKDYFINFQPSDERFVQEYTPTQPKAPLVASDQLPKLNYVAIGAQGKYAKKGFYQYSPEDVQAIADHMLSKNAKTLNIYFHGGLVNEFDGAEAVRTVTEYLNNTDDNTHNIGFIWKTGIKDVLTENFSNIFGKGLGYILQKVLLTTISNRFTPAVQVSPMSFIKSENTAPDIDSILLGKSTCPDFQSAFDPKMSDSSSKDISEEECEQLCAAVIASLDGEANNQKYWLDFTSDHTLSVKEDVEEAINSDLNQTSNEKGFVGSFRRAFLVGKILYNVLKRFRNGTGHGTIETITEEIFQQFYVSDIGTSVWSAMKTKATMMWQEKNPGADLMRALSSVPDLHVNLIGHSAGSNCIAGLLNTYDSDQHSFKLDNVILMGAACTYDVFTDSYMKHRSKYNKFFSIKMTDYNESRDRLIDNVPVISSLYPASLLYFISGVLEDPTQRFPHNSDHPVVGMSRYLEARSPYQTEHFNTVREFFDTEDNHVIEDGSIVDHGGFDNTGSTTLVKIKEILST